MTDFRGEVAYSKSDDGNVHSDIDVPVRPDSEIRVFLHSVLDEFLTNSNGDGFFYIGNYSDLAYNFDPRN